MHQWPVSVWERLHRPALWNRWVRVLDHASMNHSNQSAIISHTHIVCNLASLNILVIILFFFFSLLCFSILHKVVTLSIFLWFICWYFTFNLYIRHNFVCHLSWHFFLLCSLIMKYLLLFATFTFICLI